MSSFDLADPRVWPAPAACTPFAQRLHALAQTAIGAATRLDADALDETARRMLASALAARETMTLVDALASAPSVAVARHLRRLLAEIERGNPQANATLRTALFAVPLIIVAALERRDEAVTLSAVLPDAQPLERILRESDAFGGCETFALTTALVDAASIDIDALPGLLAREHAPDSGALRFEAIDLPPARIDVAGAGERVHLRFLACAVLIAPDADPLRESTIADWGMPFAVAVAKALRAPGVSVLALPRPAQRLVPAVQAGRAAQREVSAQLFASNAIRKLRASYGEPTAIISAHRAVDAPGGGELRLSLSSPFAPRDAEGFRCPIYPYESVQDAAAMLDALMRDCRVIDVRWMPGVHADVDPLTGGPLLFKDTGTYLEIGRTAREREGPQRAPR